MNLGEMFTEIRERLGEDEENFWSDTSIYRAINQAIARFSHEHRWNWLTVATTLDVLVNDDEIELMDDVDLNRHYNLRLVPTDGNELLAVAPERVQPDRANDLRTRYATTTTAVQPRYYYLDYRVINDYTGFTGYGEDSDNARAIGLSIRIIPAADRGYDGEFRFFRNPRKLYTPSEAADYAASGGADQEPDVPMQYQDAIIALATGNLWLKELNGGAKANEMFGIYNSILDQATKDATNLPEDGLLVWGGEAPLTARPRGRVYSGAGAFGPQGYGYLGSPSGEPSNT